MDSRAGRILLLDGGLGTSLEDEYNVKFDHDTPLWSSHLLITDPDTLRTCQKAFGRVPVDILLTATYQASIEGFARTKVASHRDGDGIGRSDIPRYLELALSIAEDAKAPNARVALSLGPYGACMLPSQEYSGAYDNDHESVAQLFRWHRERISLFSDAGGLHSRIGFVAFETVPRRDEIKAIRKLFSPTSSFRKHGTPYWISCVFPGDGYTLPDGSTVDQVIDALFDPEDSDYMPWGIGINCTKIAKLPELVQQYERAVSRLLDDGRLQKWPSLVLYPDGTNGEVYDTTTKTWRVPEEQPAPTFSWSEMLASIAGAARDKHCWASIVVGGCCKASSADIAGVRDSLAKSAASEQEETVLPKT
ncbi:Homocysteine S-methyltransferase [Xylariomycetidae sp. FL2044]|nr:Homocysteine S-methyltransferase [Xylariomycetidae sp. FL2044]